MCHQIKCTKESQTHFNCSNHDLCAVLRICCLTCSTTEPPPTHTLSPQNAYFYMKAMLHSNTTAFHIQYDKLTVTCGKK